LRAISVVAEPCCSTAIEIAEHLSPSDNSVVGSSPANHG
jgi:hypothetical protein